MYDVGIVDHAYFYGGRLQVVHDRGYLGADYVGREGMHGLYAQRVLCSDSSNDRGGVAT